MLWIQYNPEQREADEFSGASLKRQFEAVKTIAGNVFPLVGLVYISFDSIVVYDNSCPMDISDESTLLR
jgi:hypothetical protein